MCSLKKSPNEWISHDPPVQDTFKRKDSPREKNRLVGHNLGDG